MTDSTDLIQRTTLEELIGWRGKAITLAHDACAQYEVFLAKVREAQDAARMASKRVAPFGKLAEYVAEYHAKPDKFAKQVQDNIDRSMWGYLLSITGIRGLMDDQAHKEFEQQIASDPPEITADNVRATFQQFKADAHTIFRRGLVNVFTNLERQYRSHDGFKIGSRIVRQSGLSESGHLWDSRDALRDVDRIMHLLDGCKIDAGWTSSLLQMLEGQPSQGFKIRPGSITTEYWHVKWFMNRNIHLYPLRKDLVRRANRLIAEHFDEATLGEGPDAAGARKYQRARPHHSQVEDFYPSPPEVVTKLLSLAGVQPSHDVLEPSAGDGAIVKALMQMGIRPDCVEIDPDRSDELRDILPPGAVVNMDFLKMQPDPDYDRVIMNPPWGQGAGVAHVFHAVKFLKPGGMLIGVLGEGLEYRTDGPTIELRQLISQWGGVIQKLPAGSFKAAGTMANAVVFTMTKPGAALAAPPNHTGLLEFAAQ